MAEIDIIKSDTNLWNKIKFYLCDLLGAGKNVEIQHRLENSNQYYLPYFYFTEKEMEKITSINTNEGIFGEIIQQTFNKKLADNKTKNNICTSHDIFPIYQKIFNLEKNFHKNPGLLRERKKYIKKIII